MVCAISQPSEVSLRRSSELEKVLGGTFSVAYGMRSYSPELGRWINRDPIGERGGLNIWAFVGNGPLLSVDHLGRYIMTFSGDWNDDDKKNNLLAAYNKVEMNIGNVVNGLVAQYISASFNIPEECPIKDEVLKAFWTGLGDVSKLQEAMDNDETLKMKYVPVIGGDPNVLAQAGSFGAEDISWADSYFFKNETERYLKAAHELFHTLDTFVAGWFPSVGTYTHPPGGFTLPVEIIGYYREKGEGAVRAARDPYLLETLFREPSKPRFTNVLLGGIVLEKSGETGIAVSEIYDCCGGRQWCERHV